MCTTPNPNKTLNPDHEPNQHRTLTPRTTPNPNNEPDHNAENDAKPQRCRTLTTSKEANDTEHEPNHNAEYNAKPRQQARKPTMWNPNKTARVAKFVAFIVVNELAGAPVSRLLMP